MATYKNKKFSKIKKNTFKKPQNNKHLNDDGYVCIPSSELKKHHNFLELTKEVQNEINNVLKDHFHKTNKKSKTKTTTLNTETKKYIHHKRHSPYIVNLKSETKTTNQKDHTETIKHNEMNLIFFEPHDIDNQFTPLFLEEEHKKQKEKNKKRFLKIFILATLLFLFSQAFYFYIKLSETQKYILNLSEQAFSYISDGYNSLKQNDYNNANFQFSLATRQFIDAEKELSNINPIAQKIILAIPPLGKKFNTGYNTVQTGSRLSLTAKYATQGLIAFQNENTFSEKIEKLKQISTNTIPLLNESIQNINKIDISYIPKQKQEVFLDIKKQLPTIALGVENFVNLSDFLLDTLGHTEKKRYLIPFQNTAELRSTGGFIGSFALVDIYQGKITNVEVPNTGSYQLQGGLKKNIIPPKPLQLIAKRWEFQDSNWDADFVTASKKMEELFTLSWGPSVDGVITVNLSVMEDLLKVLGPIEMPKYNKIITAQNFWEEVQKSVELEYDKTQNNPKQIITDMTPIIIERITQSNTNQAINLLSLTNHALLEKNIQIFIKNPESQKTVSTYGWSGEITQTQLNDDYLYVVNNNIAGGKTDRVMERSISADSIVNNNGEIINTVKIKNTHNGNKDDEFTGIRNVSYVRVYVPQNSELLLAKGFRIPDAKYFKTPLKNATPDIRIFETENNSTILKPSDTIISSEFGKTVFGNWIMTDPSETSEIELVYKLPFKIPTTTQNQTSTTTHNFLIQKQSGTNPTVDYTFTLPSNIKLNSGKQSFSETFELKRDKEFKIIF